ncbi:MAG: hypothetical protein AAGJ73_00945 [Pseudomonadota bacterium]
MRYALRSRNSLMFNKFSRLCGGLLISAGLSACSTLGLDREPAQPDLTGDRAEEVNWSFADAARLQSEISALKAENQRLKSEMKGLRLAKAEAEKSLSEAQEEEAALDSVEAAQSGANANRGPTRTVVAAADADQALATAPAPVEGAPRLVAQSFANDDVVFENEASAGSLRISSALFGVHLASYKTMEKARAGWGELQRNFPNELGLLEPRVERIDIPERGVFLRLIGGGFSSEQKAMSLCKQLKNKGRYCAVAGFAGERLSLAEAAG